MQKLRALCLGERMPRDGVVSSRRGAGEGSFAPSCQKVVNQLSKLRLDFCHRAVGSHQLHAMRFEARNNEVTAPNSAMKVHALPLEPFLF